MKWLKLTLFVSLALLITLVVILIITSYTPPEPVQSQLKQYQLDVQQQEAEGQQDTATEAD